jgi:diadenosine tetraphosphate (Ap4A) HIT family hydrolase
MECYSCQAKAGEIKISPGPVIYQGTYWRVEHAFPAALKGWLVIVLERHAEALHELTQAEFAELSLLQRRAVTLLHQEVACSKEYIVCFAEKEGFHHIHIHVIPRLPDIRPELKGPLVFSLLKPEEHPPLSETEVTAWCTVARDKF